MNTPGIGRRTVRIVICGLAVCEIATLLYYSSRYDSSVTSGSGAQQMGLFFNGLALAALIPAALLFIFAKGRLVRSAAELVVLAPVVLVAYAALRWVVPSRLLIVAVLGLAWWWLGRVRKAKNRGAAAEAMRLDGPGPPKPDHHGAP